MRQQNSVYAGSQYLVKHPGVGTYGRPIDSVDRNVDDHRRRAMSALSRTACDQTAHVFLQAFDVERRVLHVVAYVVGVSLSVDLALLKAPGGPGMRTGIVNGLALLQQLERPVDVFRLIGRCFSQNGGSARDQTETRD